MNGNFVFNGRSRPTHLSLSRDHQPSKDAILAETRKKRERREINRVQQQAALRIQRKARLWLSRMALADLAFNLFQSIRDESQKTPGRRLERSCWDFEFFCRGKRRGVDHNSRRMMCTQVVLQQLRRSIRAGSVREELFGCQHGLDLLARLIFEEYARPPVNAEEKETLWKEEHLFLFDALLETNNSLNEKVKLWIRALQLVIQHGTSGNASVVSRIQGLYASLSASDVAVAMEAPEGREMLLEALTSSAQNGPYISPTSCALDVLLASQHEEECAVNQEANRVLLEAIVDVTASKLPEIIRFKTTAALGKLVRLTPFFLGAEGSRDGELRRKWLKCLVELTIHASRDDELLKTTIVDLMHPHIEGPAHSSRYEHLPTYLFTADCGLRLLKENASAVAALIESSTEGEASSPSRSNAFFDFNLLCSTFVWPLYNFSLKSPEQRIEVTTIFSKLVNSSELLRSLWKIYQDCHSSAPRDPSGMKKESLLTRVKAGEVAHLPFTGEPPAELLGTVTGTTSARSLFWDMYPAVSVLFFTLLSYFVDATDFMEELENGVVMDCNDAVLLLLSLKGIVHRSYMHGIFPHCNGEAVAQTALRLLTKLHVIDEVQSFVPHPSVWIAITDPMILGTFESITRETWLDVDAALEFSKLNYLEGNEGDAVQVNSASICHPHWMGSTTWSHQERIVRLLQNAPFTIPFNVRASVFSALILSCEQNMLFYSQQPFLVHRGHVFIDAFDRFANVPDSPDMFSVRFRDTNNLVEEGYGEGVYREFLVNLCTEGFAAEYGMFRQTEDGDVYPNPFSYEVTGDPQHLRRITFLGAMVGRSLRDGVVQDIPFAPHFRNAILGRSNSINNLKSFDRQLYRQIMSLRSLSEEEIENLSLTFTYTVDILDEVREVELLRGGRDIPVTRRNCLNYIHLLAGFKLNHESARQTRAFLEGLGMIVNLSWLKLFDGKEVMKLFGGDAESAIDVSDWRKHTQYHRADDEESVPVHVFWRVVEAMSLEERKRLLKFTTSMNRPPLLGFQFLNPPFKVHVEWDASEERLPSASTCFSTLKLPPYKDFKTAFSKITAAIEGTEDFGLT
ncbi:hypothetical protein ECC02_000223 [Trypanosoma cruzi]|uniref:HECT-type E3 ubiquitin transferase n=1 Tax=Trypanosoma cruzi TaxID=5693 RepID=A0A7J6YJI0_TRYCR|nr:hypothetical protein ECC02_000223 [Trypanosoma cruzi]